MRRDPVLHLSIDDIVMMPPDVGVYALIAYCRMYPQMVIDTRIKQWCRDNPALVINMGKV